MQEPGLLLPALWLLILLKSEKLLKSISKTALLKKFVAGFTIALLSSALSIFAMLKLINPEGTKPFHPKENIVLIQSPAPVHSVPVMENTKTSDQSNFINILPFVDNKGESPETNYNIHIVKNSDHASNTYHISPVNQMINNYLPVSANTPDNYFNYNINSLEESNLFDDFSLELTAHENWYDQKQLAQPSYTPRFHKQNLSIFYNLSNYFSVGAGVRSENFYLNYEESSDFQYKYIQQQPNLITTDISARVTYPVYNYVIPFLQTSGGVNRIGLTYRAGLGLEFTLYKNLSLICTGEYSGIRYKHLNKSFTDSKISFFYGLKFNF